MRKDIIKAIQVSDKLNFQIPSSLQLLFMYTIKLICFLTAAVVFFSSCKNNIRETYAIRDFEDTLRPLLIKALLEGIVRYYNAPIRNAATDEELVQLSKSEHPVLRAVAFREMLYRKSFDHFEVIMNHLDDTAIVYYDDGEFGNNPRAISDDILFEGKWKSFDNKNKTIHEVITKHNYLRGAYTVLDNLEPQEKHYPYVKEMAQRIRKYDEELGEQDFGTVEYALYGLAKFKKKDDIKIIKEKLLSNCWQLSYLSFKIMKEFSSEEYLEVLEKIYHEHYYYSYKNENEDKALDFINSIALYKNERSAKVLSLIMNDISTNRPYTKQQRSVKHELAYAIWNNPCEAYLKLRRQIEPTVQTDLAKEKKNTGIPPLYYEPFDSLAVDTSGEHLRWWQ